ncbi:MAG: hypothetical protein IPP90_00645 [Gemmatimonadaceae bacterium]|nr:hypothetical protein [Gemmatimonadaceae bacterium]
MTGLSDTVARATSIWSATLSKCPEVTSLFEECHLSLRVSQAAALLGLPNKTALRRLLVAHRLPPFQSLRNWCYVVHLTERFENEGALSAWALRRGGDPASYYKLVRETTGHSWSEVKESGPEWVRRMALQVWAPHL